MKAVRAEKVHVRIQQAAEQHDRPAQRPHLGKPVVASTASRRSRAAHLPPGRRTAAGRCRRSPASEEQPDHRQAAAASPRSNAAGEVHIATASSTAGADHRATPAPTPGTGSASSAGTPPARCPAGATRPPRSSRYAHGKHGRGDQQRREERGRLRNTQQIIDEVNSTPHADDALADRPRRPCLRSRECSTRRFTLEAGEVICCWILGLQASDGAAPDPGIRVRRRRRNPAGAVV
jgi:hypothetical protein